MKAVSLTKMRIFLLLVLCIIASGFVRNAGAVPIDGFVTPGLPPIHPNPEVLYRINEGEVITYPARGIVVSDIEFGSFTDINRSALGIDEFESFDAVLTGDVFIPSMGNFSVTMTGPVDTKVYGKVGQTTGTWIAEILSMSLSGNIGGYSVLIRESPTLHSTGTTSIAVGNNYMIDSFFDIFTELSIDGGNIWIPQGQSTRMNLTPEPATVYLLVLGSLGVLRRRRR